MTDQVIATDFLISTKASIRNLAFAITECATPEVRTELRQKLRNAVLTHEKVTNYMITKGIYSPNDLTAQLNTDLKITETALNLNQESF